MDTVCAKGKIRRNRWNGFDPIAAKLKKVKINNTAIFCNNNNNIYSENNVILDWLLTNFHVGSCF